MSQLGFDLAEDAGIPGVRRVSLMRLSGELARSFAVIGKFATEGEVTKPTRGQTGRVWFTLRDRNAQISVSVSAQRARTLRLEPGERVEVTGSLSWLSERGQAQLEAELIVPVGEGAIAAAIAATRERLRAEGLLDRRRRPIPRLPRGIGVVCGTEAAVRKDIESVIAHRFAGYPVRFLETTVQGPNAVVSIVEAIELLDRDCNCDVLVLARGGGDPMSLLPFSDEAVCRAICASSKPVVSAIGHDGDRPLSDEVADLRCGTPSIAAASIVPDENELHRELEDLHAAAASALLRRVHQSEMRLERLDLNTALLRLRDRSEDRFDAASRRFAQVRLIDRVDRAEQRLRSLAQNLRALSPERVLERGYILAQRVDGKFLRSVDDVVGGDAVTLQLIDGVLTTTVSERKKTTNAQEI